MEWIYSNESLVGFVQGATKKITGIKKGDLELKKIDKSICNQIIIDNHYSHKTATDAHTRLHLGIFFRGRLLGAMQYGYAMNPQSCGNIVGGTKVNEYYELNRLWISDELGKNTESQIISMSFKLIKEINPKIKWIQSFADGRVGVGTIYQACNFLYCGSHNLVFYKLGDEIHHRGKFTHPKRSFGRLYRQCRGNLEKVEYPQYRYIYFLHKKERQNLLLTVLDYPKVVKQRI